jgi:hypothetical protein
LNNDQNTLEINRIDSNRHRNSIDGNEFDVSELNRRVTTKKSRPTLSMTTRQINENNIESSSTINFSIHFFDYL